MNYKTIQTDFPKAFSHLVEWWSVDKNMCDHRHLFDFFDKHGIFVLPTKGTVWGYIIYDKDCHIRSINKVNYQTRTEAETAAFTKAFELLEKQLEEK